MLLGAWTGSAGSGGRGGNGGISRPVVGIRSDAISILDPSTSGGDRCGWEGFGVRNKVSISVVAAGPEVYGEDWLELSSYPVKRLGSSPMMPANMNFQYAYQSRPALGIRTVRSIA
ncbi:hypothetical protein GW17_00035668 [Ensete ventricosum]|nr:hypothetical protein GW17_00035668 [Ensete ventricosum]